MKRSFKTRMRETSLDAYKEINLSKDECTVLTAIHVLFRLKKRGCTDLEILEWLQKMTVRIPQWQINQVTGRRNRLMNKGVVNPNGTIVNQDTNNSVLTWVPVYLDWEDNDQINQEMFHQAVGV